jgi:hypothetical protein
MFPVRPFEGELGALLGSYLAKMTASLNLLRAHVGSRGLVVWQTVGNICDSKYVGDYKLVVSRIQEAASTQNQTSQLALRRQS